MTLNIHLKRAYEPALPADGHRVLVDRLWPRGVSKEKASLDEWATDLAPSTALRKFFHQSPDNWAVFVEEYRAELGAQSEALARMIEHAERETVTLVYAASDEQQNHARVLLDVLKEMHAGQG